MKDIIKDFINPKSIIKMTVSGSVGLVIGNAIKATTPAGLSIPVKLAIGLGSVVLSGMFGDLAAEHVAGELDELVVVKTKLEEETTEETTKDN